MQPISPAAYPMLDEPGYYPQNYGQPVYPYPSAPYPAPYTDMQHIGSPVLVHPLMPGSEVSPHPSSSPKKRWIFWLILLLFFIGELVLILLTMLKYPIFSYCYWDFYLFKIKKNTSKDIQAGSGKTTAASLYSSVCHGDQNDVIWCPDLCQSIKSIRYSWIYFLVGAAICGGLSLLALGLNCSSIYCCKGKCMRVFQRVMIGLALLVYVAGCCGYYFYSRFDQHFDDTIKPVSPDKKKKAKWPDPDNFEWDFGIFLMLISAIYVLIFKVVSCFLVK
jgi:hypothetical protein